MDKIQLIREMIFILRNGYSKCFCFAYERAKAGIIFNGSQTETLMLLHIPELKKYKPTKQEIDKIFGYWFDPKDTKKRIEILENILKEIEQ